MPDVVSDPAKHLQRGTADYVSAQSEEALARAEAMLIWDGFPKIVETAELGGVSGAQASRYPSVDEECLPIIHLVFANLKS
jgi:hypothetical protein